MSMQTFTNAYIETALWAETAYGAPEDDGEGNWDTSFESYGCDARDLAPGTREAFEADCADFYNANHELWEDDEQAGRDFWLTRNGHGGGFWDRGLGDVGDELTEAAHAYGSVHLYIGDGGWIYAS